MKHRHQIVGHKVRIRRSGPPPVVSSCACGCLPSRPRSDAGGNGGAVIGLHHNQFFVVTFGEGRVFCPSVKTENIGAHLSERKFGNHTLI